LKFNEIEKRINEKLDKLESDNLELIGAMAEFYSALYTIDPSDDPSAEALRKIEKEKLRDDFVNHTSVGVKKHMNLMISEYDKILVRARVEWVRKEKQKAAKAERDYVAKRRKETGYNNVFGIPDFAEWESFSSDKKEKVDPEEHSPFDSSKFDEDFPKTVEVDYTQRTEKLFGDIAKMIKNKISNLDEQKKKITEAQRHKKETGENYKDQVASNDLKNNPSIWKLFHKSDLKKMSYNPQTTFWTPFGIYFYTSNLINQKSEHLPFRSTSPYTHFVEIKKEFRKNVLIIDITEKEGSWELNGWEDKLRDLFVKYDTIERFDEYMSTESLAYKIPATNLYMGVRTLNYDEKNPIGQKQAALRFRKYLMELDILGIIDNSGTIHVNEPEQAVILDKKIITYLGFEVAPNADKVLLAKSTTNKKTQEKLFKINNENTKAIQTSLARNPNLSLELCEKMPQYVLRLNSSADRQIFTYKISDLDKRDKIFNNNNIKPVFMEYFISTQGLDVFINKIGATYDTKRSAEASNFIGLQALKFYALAKEEKILNKTLIGIRVIKKLLETCEDKQLKEKFEEVIKNQEPIIFPPELLEYLKYVNDLYSAADAFAAKEEKYLKSGMTGYQIQREYDRLQKKAFEAHKEYDKEVYKVMNIDFRYIPKKYQPEN
jgi:hypothetical protein